jgi:hypothetical protein
MNDEEIEALDQIIDNLHMAKVSGQDMLEFFRLAIAERVLELSKNQSAAARKLRLVNKTYRYWLQLDQRKKDR